MDTINQVAKYALETKYDDIPKEAIDAAKMLLTDILATSACGSAADKSPDVANLILDWGGKEESSVLVHGKKVPAPQAAFVNSLFAHAFDYDEVQSDAIVHTGVSVIPTALAVAEALGNVSGKDLLAAIVKADEVFIRFGFAIKATIFESGWIFSPLVGHFASALLASILMNLDEEQTVNALGIVYSEACGNQQASADTTLTKRMQPAFAARNGVYAAYLARAGVTGSRGIIDGKYNFFKVYLQDKCDRSELTKDLGKKYWIPTLSYKPSPVCGPNLSAVATSDKLVRENHIALSEITGIDIGVNTLAMDVSVEPKEVKYHPKTVVDAQFSLPYSVATMIVSGHLQLSDLTEDALNNKEVASLMEKIECHLDDDLVKEYHRGVGPSKVTIRTSKGEFQDCVFPKGHPTNPFTKEDMRSKFLDAMQFAAHPAKSGAPEQVLSAIDTLEYMKEASELIGIYNDAFER